VRLGIGMLFFLLLMRALFLLRIMGARHMCGGTEAELATSIQVDCNRGIDLPILWTHATRTRPDASCHAKSQHDTTVHGREYWNTASR